ASRTHVPHTLSLHDALPILPNSSPPARGDRGIHISLDPQAFSGLERRWLSKLSSAHVPHLPSSPRPPDRRLDRLHCRRADAPPRSEEHTSELQSLRHLVCRL